MDMLRRMPLGLSAELLGEKAKDKIDVKMIALGVPRAARRTEEKIRRDHQIVLER